METWYELYYFSCLKVVFHFHWQKQIISDFYNLFPGKHLPIQSQQ